MINDNYVDKRIEKMFEYSASKPIEGIFDKPLIPKYLFDRVVETDGLEFAEAHYYFYEDKRLPTIIEKNKSHIPWLKGK